MIKCVAQPADAHAIKCVVQGLVQATAALVGRLALGSPDFQRYLRLEEVLVRLVPAMAASAEMLTHKGEDHDLLVRPCCCPSCCFCLPEYSANMLLEASQTRPESTAITTSLPFSMCTMPF